MAYTTRLGRAGEGLKPLLGGALRVALPGLLLLATPGLASAQEVNGGDTAWMLISTALVLLMTAGLAFFYGGLVPSKNVLNTMMMSFIAFGFSGVLWALIGYSIAFGGSSPYIGDASMALLNGVGLEPSGTIPHILFMAYQGTFAIITAALISGAIIGRMKFGAYVAFISIWGLVVYAPVAHWVWNANGWAFTMAALDFAGGAVVHVNAGAAALAAAIVLGPRADYHRRAMLPHNVPFVLLGAGLLWFGWMGFNGGSALSSGALSSLGVVNTLFAPAATLVVWSLLDVMFSKHMTAVGAATGIVVGLVAVTPAAGFVSPMSAMIIGAVAAVPSFFVLRWRAKSRLDDSLDVFAAHGIGGITGAVLTGVFATTALNAAGQDGLLYGNPGQVVKQVIVVAVVFVYSAVLTTVILKIVGAVTGGLRPDADKERKGMDVLAHSEEGYANGEGAVLILDEELNGGAK